MQKTAKILTREFTEVVNDLIKTTIVASKALNECNIRNKAGHEMKVRQAQAKLPLLKKEMADSLFPSKLVAAFVSGPVDVLDQIAALVSTNGVVIYADQLYERVAKLVKPNLGGGRQFGVNAFFAFSQEVRSIAIDLGLSGYAAPDYKQTQVGSHNALVAHIRKLIMDSAGPSFETLFVKEQIVDKVVADLNQSSLIPVLILNAFDQNLYPLFNRSRTFDLDEKFEVTENNVNALFRKESKKKPELKTDKEPS